MSKRVYLSETTFDASSVFTSVGVPGADGIASAYALTERIATVVSKPVTYFDEYEQSDKSMRFVTRINGLKPAEGSYWALYINGVLSDTSADATIPALGDEVVWKVEPLERFSCI